MLMAGAQAQALTAELTQKPVLGELVELAGVA